MLAFEPLTLSQYGSLRGYFFADGHRTCDYTAGTTFMWRRYFATEYALIGDTLLMRARYFDGAPMYTVPIGADPAGALALLREDLRQRGEIARFCFTAEEDLPLLRSVLGTLEAVPQPDWADYVYNRAAFAALSGKKYHGQKNHVNRFRKTYPDAAFTPITEENIPAAREFVIRQYAHFPDDSDMAKAEHEAILAVLDHYALYRLQGAMLTVGGEVAGLTVGGVKGDTLYVHVEKGDTSFTGVYPMLAVSFAASVTDPAVRFLNREEDMGDAGLRRAKQSWHPAELIPKYTVICR